MNATTRYTVEIANDTPDADEFAAWLNVQGHSATVGRSTGSYIDGAWTSHDIEASEIMRSLWEAYCDQPSADI